MSNNQNTQVLTSNDKMSNVITEYFAQVKNLKIITEIVKKQKAEILEYMTNQKIDKIELLGFGELTKVITDETFIVDSKKLKETYNDIYQECVKVRKGSVKLLDKKY